MQNSFSVTIILYLGENYCLCLMDIISINDSFAVVPDARRVPNNHKYYPFQQP
jgi:hypothetical protein